MAIKCGYLKNWLLVLLLLGTTAYVVAEDLTLTTYYPSPRGVYNELRTAGDVAIGEINPPNPVPARLYVAGESGKNAVQIVDRAGPGATTQFVVTDTGNIGIKTPAPPTQPLDVAGNAIVSGQVGLGNLPGDPLPTDTVGNGAIYYNTSMNKVRVFEGGAWKDLGGGGAVSESLSGWCKVNDIVGCSQSQALPPAFTYVDPADPLGDCQCGCNAPFSPIQTGSHATYRFYACYSP